ncbi:hypothetical protein ACFXB3_05715 [Streptomyces sp. NPDC059447]|uniref:hypothetical protein n=1 Tax=unclassified Streptomyces TaxID=2593676 RepID=UPI0036BFEEFA
MAGIQRLSGISGAVVAAALLGTVASGSAFAAPGTGVTASVVLTPGDVVRDLRAGLSGLAGAVVKPADDQWN